MSTRTCTCALVVLFAAFGVACGEGTSDEEETTPDAGTSQRDVGDQGPDPVSTDLEVPSGKEYRLELSGGQTADIRGARGSVTFRSETVAVDLSGLEFTMSANYDIEEGETGTFASVQTPQLTYEGTRYVSKDGPVVVTIETFSDNTFEAAIAGEFGYTRNNSGDDTALDEPIEVEGKMSFDYERRQRPSGPDGGI